MNTSLERAGLSRFAPAGRSADRAVIGLTGNPGAGKSAVARRMAQNGAEVIDADALGHELLLASSPVTGEIAAEFGDEVLTPDGDIDRKRLGAIVFDSRERLEALNRIVHPRITEAIRARIERFRAEDRLGPLVVDAALIFEWGDMEEFDAVAVVTAPLDLRRERYTKSRGVGAEAFARREAAQWSQEEKIKRADVVIANDDSLESLYARVDQFMKT